MRNQELRRPNCKQLCPLSSLGGFTFRSQGAATSYADHEAERTPWYTSIKCAQEMGAITTIMDLQFVRQR